MLHSHLSIELELGALRYFARYHLELFIFFEYHEMKMEIVNSVKTTCAQVAL